MSLKAKLKSVADSIVRTVAEPVVANYLSRTMAPRLIELLRQPTEAWKHKPRFASVVAREREGIVLRVFTDSDIYMWVSRGTKKHTIKPNPGRRLRRGMRRPWERERQRKLMVRFPEAYYASTRSGSLSSQKPRRSGTYFFARATEVGIRPRMFGKTAVEQLRGEMRSSLPGFLRVQFEKVGMAVEVVRWE